MAVSVSKYDNWRGYGQDRGCGQDIGCKIFFLATPALYKVATIFFNMEIQVLTLDFEGTLTLVRGDI